MDLSTNTITLLLCPLEYIFSNEAALASKHISPFEENRYYYYYYYKTIIRLLHLIILKIAFR